MRSTATIIASNILRLRRELGIEPEHLAKRAGITLDFFDRIEDGVETPTPRAMIALGALLGTTGARLRGEYLNAGPLPLWTGHQPRRGDLPHDLRLQVVAGIEAKKINFKIGGEVLGLTQWRVKDLLDESRAARGLPPMTGSIGHLNVGERKRKAERRAKRKNKCKAGRNRAKISPCVPADVIAARRALAKERNRIRVSQRYHERRREQGFESSSYEERRAARA